MGDVTKKMSDGTRTSSYHSSVLPSKSALDIIKPCDDRLKLR